MEKRFIYGPEFTRAGDDDKWIIEGYASTDAVDSYNEIVDPEAFRGSLERFLEFPVALAMHSWFEVAIGKVVEAEIRDKGLWVKVEISKSAPQIWTLIQEGILKAFSIGFSGTKIEMTDDDRPDVWKEIELLEISVVNVPANREALFSVAGAKGIDLSPFTKNATQSITTKQKGAGMDFTLDQVEEKVGAAVKTLTPTIEAAATSAAKSALKTPLAEFKSTLDDAGKTLTEVSEALKGCATKAEVEEMKGKVEASVSAVVAKANRETAKGISDITETLDVPLPISTRAFEEDLAR